VLEKVTVQARDYDFTRDVTFHFDRPGDVPYLVILSLTRRSDIEETAATFRRAADFLDKQGGKLEGRGVQFLDKGQVEILRARAEGNP
jgi:hypothetical protein